jgi:hypothetical protein
MIVRSVLATLLFCAIGLWPKAADACSCAMSGMPCDAAWRADAVFVGNVVSIETLTVPAGVLRGRRVDLAVVEAFRGLQLSEVTVYTGYGGADCGYPFVMGESFVVYAYRTPEGHLTTGICARTRPVSNAPEDLAYLRSLKTIVPGAPARIAGRVQVWDWSKPSGAQASSIGGVAVTATREGRSVSTRANDRGEFELTGLSLGTYELVAQAPDGYDSVPRTLEIHDPRGCGTTSLLVRYDGRVTGRVVDSKGNGVQGLPIELLGSADVDKPGGSSTIPKAWTAADGTFTMRLVAPGEYVLGFNSIRGHDGQLTFPRAFYPGVTEPAAAGRVAVGVGTRARLRDFVVPENIRLVTVNGIVVDEANQPVREATITLTDSTEGPNSVGSPVTTGADGRFTFALVEGGKYELRARRYVGTDVRTRELQMMTMTQLTVSSATPLVTLVMKPNRF